MTRTNAARLVPDASALSQPSDVQEVPRGPKAFLLQRRDGGLILDVRHDKHAHTWGVYLDKLPLGEGMDKRGARAYGLLVHARWTGAFLPTGAPVQRVERFAPLAHITQREALRSWLGNRTVEGCAYVCDGHSMLRRRDVMPGCDTLTDALTAPSATQAGDVDLSMLRMFLSPPLDECVGVDVLGWAQTPTVRVAHILARGRVVYADADKLALAIKATRPEGIAWHWHDARREKSKHGEGAVVLLRGMAVVGYVNGRRQDPKDLDEGCTMDTTEALDRRALGAL